MLNRALITILIFVTLTTPLVSSGPWRSHVGPEGQVGNFKRGGGADAWVPFCQTDNRVFFTQGGGGWFRDAGVGTLGVGYRQLQCNGRWALGVNGFIDGAYSNHSRKAFGQVGAGVELFSCHWIARGNFYAPFTGGKFAGSTLDTQLVQQGIIVFSETFRRTNRERILPGAEGEVGYEGGLWCGRLGLYAGYSYFTRSGIEAIHGFKARAEYRIDLGCPWPNNWGELILGVEYDRDRVHGQTALVRGGWRYYFGCKKCCGCYSNLHRYMGRRVWREKAPWFVNKVNSTLVDRELVGSLIFANNLIDGIGTQTDPATLPVGLGLLGPNDVLFLLQDTGDMTAAATITPPTGSQILGFGDQSCRAVTFPSFGTIVVQDLTGAGRARVDGGVLDPIVETANNNFICGIELIDGVTGVNQGAGINNVRIEDVIFTDPTTSGIVSSAGGALTVDQVQITTPGIGINLSSTTGNVSIVGTATQNTMISAPLGININSPVVGSTRISNTTVMASGTEGIFLTNNIDTRIDKSTVTNTGGAGISMLQIGLAPAADVRISNSTITASSFGINSGWTTSSVLVVDSNRVSAQTGVLVDLNSGTAHNILVTNNDVTADFGVGFNIMGAGNIEISRNRVTMTAASDAITASYFGSGGTTNVSFLNNFQLGVSAGRGYVAEVIGVTGGTYCATFVGNRRAVSTATDIVIAGNAFVTLDVWDLANLSATNNGLMVTNSGFTAQAVGPCPLPVIP